jgi:hypothetical protein
MSSLLLEKADQTAAHNVEKFGTVPLARAELKR